MYKKLIDLSMLVLKPPINKRQKLNKQDLEYLFITINLCDEEIADFYNRSIVSIGNWRKKFKIIKSQTLVEQCKKRRSLQKYGVDSPAKLQTTRDKYKRTCLQKYGSDNIFSSEIGKTLVIQGTLNKYGVKYNHQNKQIIDKMKNTCLEKYGYECSLMDATVYKKAQDTWIINLGVDNPGKSETIKQRIKNTNIERYGVEFASQNEQIKQKIVNSMPQKLNKEYSTKKKNNSFNISKKEELIYHKLITKFQVIRQYKSGVYPFACDFYIPGLDLYIEFNGHWTHGGFPYEKTDICRQQLETWIQKAKISKYYQNAIYTWTDLDVRKRNLALENNLRWVEFFNLNQFEIWFFKQ